jgi:hypothetical protein
MIEKVLFHIQRLNLTFINFIWLFNFNLSFLVIHQLYGTISGLLRVL